MRLKIIKFLVSVLAVLAMADVSLRYNGDCRHIVNFFSSRNFSDKNATNCIESILVDDKI